MAEVTEQTVYLNGEYVPLSQARVPVLDRGFIFGDGVYEVVPAYGRTPFRWAGHLRRLERSLAKTRIANPMTGAQWTELIETLIARHPWDDQFVYLQVTRGVARRDHAFPSGVAPTVFAMSSPLTLPSAAQVDAGVAAITMADERWLHCDIKSTSLLGNVFARQAAVDAGAFESVLFRGEQLTEASASNVWVVRDGRVLAPPRDNLILEGIRYGLIEELCRSLDIGFEARRLTRAEVETADELMLSSATKELIAITRLDGRPVGSGQPGPVFRRLYEGYQQAKRSSAAQDAAAVGASARR
jgi:D-alanine transaminase